MGKEDIANYIATEAARARAGAKHIKQTAGAITPAELESFVHDMGWEKVSATFRSSSCLGQEIVIPFSRSAFGVPFDLGPILLVLADRERQRLDMKGARDASEPKAAIPPLSVEGGVGTLPGRAGQAAGIGDKGKAADAKLDRIIELLEGLSAAARLAGAAS